MLRVLIACLALTLGNGRLVAKREKAAVADWPPAAEIYDKADAPPSWMQAPADALPAVPRNPPAPVPAGALIPTDPYVINSAYFDEMSRQAPSVASGADTDKAWPPSPPQGLPAAVPGVPGMRPWTLLDAKGGEYAKDTPDLSAKGKKK